MLMHNSDIADVFAEIADLLEIQDANPFRVRAYRNAARTLQTYGPSLQALIAQDKEVPHLPGIGADLAGKIREIVATGSCGVREELRRALPPGIRALLGVPGLGPRRVRLLHDALQVDSLEALERACRDGLVAGLHGMGAKGQQRILAAVHDKLTKERRFGIARAEELAHSLLDHLHAADPQAHIAVAGSFRRARETVGDLDIVASSRMPSVLIGALVAFDGVTEVMAQGGTRASVRLRQGMQVDLRVVAHACYGAALHYFTGSKAHNIAIRALARQRGLKINEYGVFSEETRIAGATELSVFQSVGLPFIPPELREDRGEIDAAREGRLPTLVTLADLKGDLHCHTRASDGRNSLREMALAAAARGFAYLAITDHSHSLAVTGGLDADALARQADEIDALNAELAALAALAEPADAAGRSRHHPLVLLKGVEAEILEDGRLDLPDDVLRRLDLVIGAVHSHFDLPAARQTDRVLRAMDHPCFTLLAHPTGRLLGERDAFAIDMERVIGHARARACFLELDAQPDRLDMNDVWCRQARDQGVPVAIDSDAHSTLDVDNLRFGIGQARRGWLERGDVLNTLSLPALRRRLREARR